MPRRLVLAFGLVLGFGFSAGAPIAGTGRNELPSRLSDRDFWRLIVDSSEADGYFRSDNLTSNELLYQRVIPDLVRRTRPDAVYLGVGPEQNFTYMAALRPAFAVIFDVRRGNMLVQLMYKALFELAKDRAAFVSMLFSRPRPRGLGPESTAADLFSSLGSLPGDEALYTRNLKAVQDHLTKTRGLPLSTRDLEGIEYAYHAFYSRGFAIRFQPTYADLMVQTDNDGMARSSNVEQYLHQDGKWAAFCRNVAALPLDQSSTFIRSASGRGLGFGVGFVSSLGSMAAETRECR